MVDEALTLGLPQSDTLRVVDENVPCRGVQASRGKLVRAEPVSALYEQDRVHHVGAHPDLQDQLCSHAPGSGKSPDRLDAPVHALTDLITGPGGFGMIEWMRREVEIAQVGLSAGPGGKAAMRWRWPQHPSRHRA